MTGGKRSPTCARSVMNAWLWEPPPSPNKVLVFGGYSTEAQGQFTRTIESFDIRSGRCKCDERLCVPRATPNSLVVHDDRVYALLGVKLLKMGVNNDGWEDIGDVPTQLITTHCATSSKRGILVGGASGVSSSIELFVCQVLGKSLSWNKLDIPHHSNGFVQGTCIIQALF
ncbi:hypothetical protein GOP47_0019151 [Adiantum capillus-veneris]|uniref:Uncharacterized protein n=1 Tax=Adiantum capillus-veneris TaxID=13818 RepID=A0A9D4UF22_ADICA|nr:hypothetical protein GOP47_0019151 [Adiantum capillus-veneris]